MPPGCPRLSAGGSATLVPLDLKDYAGIDRLGLALGERFGRLDVLVGNAGILGPLSPLGHVDVKTWDEVMAVNVTANWRLICAMDPLLRLSDAGRAVEAQKLLNWGFQTFDTLQLYQSGKPVSTLHVWKGAQPEVKAGFLADRYLTLPKGKAAGLALTLEAQEPLVAPVARAQRVGVVKVALDGRPVAEFPLIALEEVPLGSLFGRAWDTVRLWFK